ncbi:22708_t:CDS:2, partial [Cetraspora pellucida]
MYKTFELSIEDFDKQWILVNNIWTRFNKYKLDNGNECKTFVCRLSKSKESSERKENIPSEKLRMSGTPDHSHSIEENDMCKRSKFIKDMVGNEAIKNYKPPIITDVIRKEVSKLYEDSGVEYLKTKKVANIKQKLVGPMNLHLVGGTDLQSNILSTNEFLLKNNYQETSEAVAAALKIIRTFAP